MQRSDYLKPLKCIVLIQVSNLTLTSALVKRRLTAGGNGEIVYQLKGHI